MSGHPLQRYAETLAAIGARRPGDLTQSEADCTIGGIVTGLRPLKTKRGDRMAVFMLEDDVAKVEAVVFPEAFAKYGGLVVDEAMLLVQGQVRSRRRNQPARGRRDLVARRRARARRA